VSRHKDLPWPRRFTTGFDDVTALSHGRLDRPPDRTRRELSTAGYGVGRATTPAMSRMRFRGAKIAEMGLVLDVLGFARHIAALRDAVSKSETARMASPRHSQMKPGDAWTSLEDAAGSSVYTIHDFEVLRCIGHGAFGKVWLARERATGVKYALKAMQKDFLRKAVAENTLTWRRAVAEKQVHSTLPRHPFVVEWHGAFHNDEVGRLYLQVVK
jgi:hypothetical protein